jgi:hypothetical protein
LYFRGTILKQLFSLQKIIVSHLLFFLSLNCLAGDPFCFKESARETGTGGICLLDNDIWSSFKNQASLAFNNSINFGFNYENRFGIKELGTGTACLSVPYGKVSLGAIYSRFGYSDFRRELFGAGCGMILSKVISGGIQIDYLTEKAIGEYNNPGILTCEAGVILSINEHLKAGIHLFNPIPNSLRRSGLTSELETSVVIKLNESLSAAAEIKMRMGEIMFIKTGFEYDAYRKFKVRGGFSSENNSFCFGIGYEAGPARIDIGFASHEKLGITSSISMTFDIKSFNRKEHKNLREEREVTKN